MGNLLAQQGFRAYVGTARGAAEEWGAIPHAPATQCSLSSKIMGNVVLYLDGPSVLACMQINRQWNATLKDAPSSLTARQALAGRRLQLQAEATQCIRECNAIINDSRSREPYAG